MVELYHDTVLLSQSPSENANQDLVVTGIPTPFVVTASSVVPKNAAEYSTYEITLQTAFEFTAAQALNIVFTFPTTYPDALVSDGMSLVCSSEPTASACKISGNREVTFENFSATAANEDLKFTMFGITNPSTAGPSFETGDLRVEAVDATGVVYASLTSSKHWILADPPKMLNMTYVYADELRSDS